MSYSLRNTLSKIVDIHSLLNCAKVTVRSLNIDSMERSGVTLLLDVIENRVQDIRENLSLKTDSQTDVETEPQLAYYMSKLNYMEVDFGFTEGDPTIDHLVEYDPKNEIITTYGDSVAEARAKAKEIIDRFWLRTPPELEDVARKLGLSIKDSLSG